MILGRDRILLQFPEGQCYEAAGGATSIYCDVLNTRYYGCLFLSLHLLSPLSSPRHNVGVDLMFYSEF